jgi:hypothetical protein
MENNDNNSTNVSSTYTDTEDNADNPSAKVKTFNILFYITIAVALISVVVLAC